MSPVRRLILDITPLGWVWVAAMLLYVVAGQAAWLHDGSSLPLISAYLLANTYTVAVNRLPVWNTLPVTRRQIDRARWWWSTGLPWLAFPLLIIPINICAKLAHGPHAPWGEAMLMAAVQSALAVAMSATFVAISWARTRLAASSLLLFIPVMLLTWSLWPTIRVHTPSEQLRAAALALGGVIGAASLYALAGAWPTTRLTNPFDRSAQRSASKRETQRGALGWLALTQPVLSLFGMTWLAMPVLALIVLQLSSQRLPALFAAGLPLLATTSFAPQSAATGIRALRALPYTANGLLLRLTLLLTALPAIGLLVLVGTTAILKLGDPPPLLMLVAAMPVLLFPLYLRFGQRLASIINGLVFGVFSGTISFLYAGHLRSHLVPSIGIGLALLAMGFSWTRWELTRGSHAWRARPLGAARWRGVD